MVGTNLDPFSDRYAERTHGMNVSEVRALFAVASRPEVVSLAGGSPFVSALPFDAVGSMVDELVRGRGAQALQYGIGQGDQRLRELICGVMALEGISASAENVVVTVGSQQALNLVARVFVDPGDVILAEAPSYVGALSAFLASQADIVHVAMDDDGLVPAALSEAITAVRASGRRIKFLYTIPNFHNPAGVTLAEGRRDEILAICEQAGILVLEDNPYGLLGFEGEPSRALRARDDNVIYLGSFSKTFSSGLRVGWVLAPHPIREKLVLMSEAEVLCPPTFSQFIVAEYLTTMPWQQQLKVFREIYRERRDAMLSALTDYFPDGCTWTVPAGGFFVWLTTPEGVDTKAMQPLAISERVAYVPGVGFYADGNGRRDMRLSYCLPPPERIREGVRRLAGVLEQQLDLVETFGPMSASTRDPAGPRGWIAGPSADQV
ncbi:MAG: 2-aminoadipate transaminase [Frankiaceae bacterium]|nr:2-aminoadipate transaminase [Frankiaceae bacterium]